MASDRGGLDAERDDLEGARDRRRGAHRVGGQSRLPRVSPLGVSRRRPRPRRRAANRPRPSARGGVRTGPRGRLVRQGAPRRARHRGVPEDQRQPRLARLLPSRTPLGRDRGSCRGRGARRELERRRPDLVTANWWKEERGERVFVDFNQNAPHKTVFGAWSARSRSYAQVSTPLAWDDVAGVDPDELTIATVPDRLGRLGDPWAAMPDDPQSLEPLLELAARDRAAGLRDAPWPPQYPKQPDEPSRVAPSRAKKD